MSPEGLSGGCLVEDAGAGFPCCLWQGFLLLASTEGRIVHIFLGPRASELRLHCGRSGNSEDRIARTVHRLDSETEGRVRTWGSGGGQQGGCGLQGQGLVSNLGRQLRVLAFSICGTRLTSKAFCILEWQGADFSEEHLTGPCCFSCLLFS